MQQQKTSTRRVLLILTIIAVVLIGIPTALVVWGGSVLGATHELESEEALVAAVTGRWAWSNQSCEEEWQDITFSPDWSEMHIAHPRSFVGADGVEDSITSYDVHEIGRDRVRGQIPGETRLNDAGEPVIWELVLRGPDRFAWRSTDWGPGRFTRDVRRCPE